MDYCRVSHRWRSKSRRKRIHYCWYSFPNSKSWILCLSLLNEKIKILFSNPSSTTMGWVLLLISPIAPATGPMPTPPTTSLSMKRAVWPIRSSMQEATLRAAPVWSNSARAMTTRTWAAGRSKTRWRAAWAIRTHSIGTCMRAMTRSIWSIRVGGTLLPVSCLLRVVLWELSPAS